ncbi:phage major capsid protein [Rhodococcus sp. BH4]|uniref:phage major capsid protein n=1 Tax=Rhodococcus sp. BH4 TaxID=1807790 RepID=UPI0009D98550|nr:phage major capsid protein [Rhodococcus sp. BH4]
MTIDFRSTQFARFHGMSDADLEAERDKLLAEAGQLTTRSALTPEQSERFEAVAADLEYLGHCESQRARMVAAMNSGSFEAGTPFTPSAPKPARNPLEGALTLTRGQSFAEHHRVNGGTQEIARPGSFDRLVRGMVTGDWRGASEERAMLEGTNSAGGFLVPTPLADHVIDLARNKIQVLAAGATTVPMTSQTLRIPRLTGEGSPTWRNELATISAADMTFDSVTLTARSLDRLILVSNELFQDSDPSAGDVIAHSFAAQIALALDLAALRGSGVAPIPLGILGTSGVTVTSHGANGTAMSYDFLLDAMATVRGNNFEPNAAIVAPRTLQSLSKAKDTQGRYLDPPTGLIPLLPSKQVPINNTVGTSSDTSELYVGQWDQLYIGIRAGFSLRLLPERYADQGAVGFLANIRADIAVAQPGAFSVDVGVRP